MLNLMHVKVFQLIEICHGHKFHELMFGHTLRSNPEIVLNFASGGSHVETGSL